MQAQRSRTGLFTSSQVPHGRAKAARKIASLVVVGCAAYSCAFFIFGAVFVPPAGPLFALILVWLLGHVGGFLAVQVCIWQQIHATLRALNLQFIFHQSAHLGATAAVPPSL